MNFMDDTQIIFPDHIAIIGGGRWARVLTEALSKITPLSSKITVFTSHNKDQMTVWVDNQGLSQRIQVTSSWPCFNDTEVNAAIVVNAARDHEYAVEKLLSEYVSVLVEKPVTLTAKATQRLIHLAEKNKTYFAAAHIFLFASYIDNFLKLATTKNEIKKFLINWTDPASESRYGENKQYDPGLPIIMDWYPHILSILSSVFPVYSCTCNSINFERGGASLDINMTLGKISCFIKIERNAEKRQRKFSIQTDEKIIALDFTVEPGFITLDNQSDYICGDNNWQNRCRPSSLMLKSFFHGVTSKKYDERIDIQKGLFANKAIDQAMLIYRKEQAKWLWSKVKAKPEKDENLYYAVAEIFQAGGLLSKTQLEEKLKRIQSYFSGSSDNSDLMHSFLEAESPSNYLNNIIRTVI